MIVPLFPYRNKANGLIGLMTHEQAAAFPGQFEYVPDGVPTPPPVPPTPLVGLKPYSVEGYYFL